MAKRRAQQNLIRNWVGIVLTVLSIVQSLAFAYLVYLVPDVYKDLRVTKNYVVATHLALCFVILVRTYQTILAAVLDYDFLLPRAFEMLIVTAIGIVEYFLFSSLTVEAFNPGSFHKRGIFMCCLAAIGYFITLRRFMVGRRKSLMRNLIPFKSTRRGKHRRQGCKYDVIARYLIFLRLRYRVPKADFIEVWLQEVNIISLLVIIAIEALIVLYSPGDWKLTGLVTVIIGILCANVFYSTRVTFGRRQKPSKAQHS